MNNLRAFVGVDPGKSGAFCLLIPHLRLIEFMDNKDSPRDIHAWIQLNHAKHGISVIMLEQVRSVPGTSAGSNFSFGYNTGGPNWLAETIGCSVDHVLPKAWQKYLGLVVPAGLKGTARKTRIKKEVGKIIERLYPGVEIYGPRGGLLDGRADALAIAHFASHKWRI